jgi:redox-sensitive bicupin YhaK (pirin superfamily)
MVSIPVPCPAVWFVPVAPDSTMVPVETNNVGAADRTVARIVTAHQQREGAGFMVRRPLPTTGLDHLDPFLMLDEVGPVDNGPGEALGAPDHPHRGFETISYIVAGEKLHEDSSGATQLIGAGDVQWMTAGAGIVHSEMPGPSMQRDGGRAHGFQIWVNLPAKSKLAAPGYQYLPKTGIPVATSPDGLIEVTVIAGDVFSVSAAISTHTPVWLQDWRIQPGASAVIEIEPDFNAAAYVFDGQAAFGRDDAVVERSQMALFSTGGRLKISAASNSDGGRFLLLGGEPINEPVARYGPFVMNTRDELITAFDDYQSGRMGVIQRA